MQASKRGFQTALAATLIVLMGANLPTMAQVPAQVPIVKEGKTVKISPHVYLIPDEKVGMVPNVGIIVGSRATLVVDPGMGMKSGEAVMHEVAKVRKNTQLYIVNTHFHPEHTTGEIAFPNNTKILRAHAQQQDIDEMGLKWVAMFASRSPMLSEVLRGAKFRAPAEIFEKEKIIDLGGVRVKLLRLGPGHTRGDTAIFVEDDSVLFSGDLAMKQLFPAFATPQSRLDSWLTSLDALDALHPKQVIGAHYPMSDASMISAYRGFLTALRDRVAEMKKQGKSSDETAETLRAEFRSKYPDWDQPLRIHMAATAIYKELQ
jgi:glyoxylase-like metal-dependent hydrolase (beta-lactamase superfamily II)